MHIRYIFVYILLWLSYGFKTKSPTIAPTINPTIYPSAKPNSNPKLTMQPTTSPTLSSDHVITEKISYKNISFSLSFSQNIFTFFVNNSLTSLKINQCNNIIQNVQNYSINYVYDYLLKTCQFNHTGNIFYGKVIIDNNLIFDTIIIIENGLVDDIKLLIENISESININVVYPSLLSYKGESYNNSINSFTIIGISNICFRQTIFGITNNFVLSSLNSIIYCNNLQNISVNTYGITDVYNDSTYLVEYCINNNFLLSYSNDFNCVGKYESKITLIPFETKFKRNLRNVAITVTSNSNVIVTYNYEYDNIVTILFVLIIVSFFAIYFYCTHRMKTIEIENEEETFKLIVLSLW